MTENKDLTKLTNEELENQFSESKKLFYPSVFVFIITLCFGIYAATHRGMGFFKLILFMIVCFTCLKYISQYSKIQKEMKNRNLK